MGAWHLNVLCQALCFLQKNTWAWQHCELGHAIEYGEAVDFGNEGLMMGMMGMHVTGCGCGILVH